MLSLFYIMYWLTACMDIGVRSGAREAEGRAIEKGAQIMTSYMLSLFYIMFWLTACMDIGVRSGGARPKAEP
jgi:hypothetical protein